MDVRRFVSGTAVLLAAWLTVTFFLEVPSQRYPRMEKHQSVTALAPVPIDPTAAVDEGSLPVSFSH